MLSKAPGDVRALVRLARLPFFAAHELRRPLNRETGGNDTSRLHHHRQSADQYAVGLDRSWGVVPLPETVLERLDVGIQARRPISGYGIKLLAHQLAPLSLEHRQGTADNEGARLCRRRCPERVGVTSFARHTRHNPGHGIMAKLVKRGSVPVNRLE